MTRQLFKIDLWCWYDCFNESLTYAKTWRGACFGIYWICYLKHIPLQGSIIALHWWLMVTSSSRGKPAHFKYNAQYQWFQGVSEATSSVGVISLSINIERKQPQPSVAPCDSTKNHIHLIHISTWSWKADCIITQCKQLVTKNMSLILSLYVYSTSDSPQCLNVSPQFRVPHKCIKEIVHSLPLTGKGGDSFDCMLYWAGRSRVQNALLPTIFCRQALKQPVEQNDGTSCPRKGNDNKGNGFFQFWCALVQGGV